MTTLSLFEYDVPKVEPRKRKLREAAEFLWKIIREDYVLVLIIAGFVITIAFIFDLKNISFPNLIFWVLEGIVIAFFTALIKKIADIMAEYETRNALNQVSLSAHIETLKELSELMIFLQKYAKVLSNSIMVNDPKISKLSSIFEQLPKDFGGIVIGANEKDYVRKLSELVPLTVGSFCATLRGGFKPEYTLNWFYTDSKLGTATILSSKEKIEYLRLVNELRIPTENKIRIIILDKDKNELDEFVRDDWRTDFFRNNSNVQVLLIKPDQLIDNLIRLDIKINDIEIQHEGETAFIWDDYAIFDGNIAVKHNGKNSLYLGVVDQIQKMMLPFELYKQHKNLFNKLNEEGMYIFDGSRNAWTIEKTWNQWKAEKKP
jgi:hypothetical protein